MYSEVVDVKISESLKSGNALDLAVWRAIKAEFINFKTAKAGNSLNDEVEIKIISKMVSQRKDSYEQYKSAGRDDLADKEYNELNILQGLLPKEPTEDDINIMVTKFIEDNTVDGVKPTMKNMKDCMSYIKGEYPTANGGVVSKIFKEKIS